MSTHTPWGPSQGSTAIARGIVEYTTSSHGGIHLTAARVLQMPPAFQAEAKTHGCITTKGDAWFEEDCHWSMVALSFPEFFDRPGRLASAEKSLKNWHPDAWIGWKGEDLPLSESLVLRERAFNAAAKNSHVCLAAWGDWAEHVPEGMVGIYARLGGRAGTDLVGSSWLVSAAEYQNRNNDPRHEFGFLIDPARHQRVNVEFGASKQKTLTVQKMLAQVHH